MLTSARPASASWLSDRCSRQRRSSAPTDGGEVVVLNFWATWCLPCLAEMPDLEALHQELGPEGVRIVGISQDTGGADEMRPYAERLGVSYPLLPDPAFQVSTRYGGVSVLPTTIFIDRDGRVAQEEMGVLPPAKLRSIVETLAGVTPPATAGP